MQVVGEMVAGNARRNFYQPGRSAVTYRKRETPDGTIEVKNLPSNCITMVLNSLCVCYIIFFCFFKKQVVILLFDRNKPIFMLKRAFLNHKSFALSINVNCSSGRIH